MKKCLMILLSACILWSCDDDDDNDSQEINNTDRDFVMKASMGNTAEIDAGQLAATKALDAGIKSYGQMMVTDHTQSKSQLEAIASVLNLHAPDSLDAEHVALKNQLMSLSGRAFDSVYIMSQVMDHQTMISLHEREVDQGNNEQLRNYASNILPHLRHHLHKADSLAGAFR